MSYYTQYELEILHGDASVDHEKQISDKTPYPNCFGDEEIKWVDHESVMRFYSKEFPETVFLLKGSGERFEDVWQEYYKNGRMQRTEARIAFDAFDESALQ